MIILKIALFIITLLALFIGFLINKLYIRPSLLLRYYKKQGMFTEYLAPLGHMTRIRKDFNELGDSFGSSKLFAKSHPNMPLRAINFGDNVMVAINSPELLKEFFRNQNLYAKYRYFIRPLRIVAGLGILTSEGPHWKKHRKIISNFFHYNFFVENIPVVRNVVVEFFERMKTQSMDKVHIMDDIQLISGEIIGRMFFSEELFKITMKKTQRPLQLEIADLLGDLTSEARTFLPALLGSEIIAKGYFKRHRDILERREEVIATLGGLINQRKASGNQKDDLMGLLIKTQQDPDPANVLSDQDIIDEFFTFVAAGMDTTGHLFTMALYSLTLHPEYLEELKQERDLYYNSEKVDSDSLRKMDQLGAFIKECLRMYSPVPAPMPMEATKTHKLGEYTIKEGTAIRPDYFFNNFNERYFADPYKFNPKRWFETDVLALDPYVHIPFSSGSRNCIGQHLAIIEAKIMLSEFLNRFDFMNPVQPYNPKLLMRMLYEPVPEFLINLTPK